MDFTDLMKERHSAIKFEKGIKIPESDIKDIYNEVKNSPSVFNLQPVKFLVVQDEVLKDKIYKLSNEQYKLHTASAIVLVLANKNFAEESVTVYEPMKMLGMIDNDDYNNMITTIDTWYSNMSDTEKVLEAQKNAMVFATSWLFASKNKGWDTCPMHIYNFDKLCDIFNIPNGTKNKEGYLPVLMIPMGKADDAKIRKRGFRKPYFSAVSVDKF